VDKFAATRKNKHGEDCPCFCIGPQDGEKHCPCVLRQMNKEKMLDGIVTDRPIKSIKGSDSERIMLNNRNIRPRD